jgi:hypothetical protein
MMYHVTLGPKQWDNHMQKSLTIYPNDLSIFWTQCDTLVFFGMMEESYVKN